MADTMFVKEAAELWNISERRVSTLCKEGKIQGAEKQGKSWLIPADVEKPADGRVKSGLYKKSAVPLIFLCLSVFPTTAWHLRSITMLIRQ